MPKRDKERGDYKSCPRVRINGKKKRVSHIVLKNAGYKLNDDDVVHHIDGDTQNNNIDNLQIMSISEHVKLHNPRDYLRYGVSAAENKQYWMQQCRKEINPNYGNRLKVTKEIVEGVNQMLAEGYKQKEIAKKFKIDQSAVSRIKNNKRYKTDYGWLINKQEVVIHDK